MKTKKRAPRIGRGARRSAPSFFDGRIAMAIARGVWRKDRARHQMPAGDDAPCPSDRVERKTQPPGKPPAPRICKPAPTGSPPNACANAPSAPPSANSKAASRYSNTKLSHIRGRCARDDTRCKDLTLATAGRRLRRRLRCSVSLGISAGSKQIVDVEAQLRVIVLLLTTHR